MGQLDESQNFPKVTSVYNAVLTDRLLHPSPRSLLPQSQTILKTRTVMSSETCAVKYN
jgi:hypothetical protein